MTTRLQSLVGFGVLLAWLPVCAEATWDIRVLDSGGDAGRFARLAIEDAGDLRAVYLSQDGGQDSALVKMMSTTNGTWGAAQVVDPFGQAGGHLSLAIGTHPTPRVCYRRGDTSSLWFAGPEETSVWNVTVIETQGDVGRYAALKIAEDGRLTASFQETAGGALLFTTRDSHGHWSERVVVDPGPYRGQYADHAEKRGGGFSFSERDTEGQVLIFADPFLHATEWYTETVYRTDDAGRYTSLEMTLNNLPGCSFFVYPTDSNGELWVAERMASSAWILSTVADSIGDVGAEGICADVAFGGGPEWHLSFRSGVDRFLYYAASDSALAPTAINKDGHIAVSVPTAYKIYPTCPNPFDERTMIRYDIPLSKWVHLRIYDVAGRLVRTLETRVREPGRHAALWDSRDERGRVVASGVYFVRLEAGDFSATQKLVRLK